MLPRLAVEFRRVILPLGRRHGLADLKTPTPQIPVRQVPDMVVCGASCGAILPDYCI